MIRHLTHYLSRILIGTPMIIKGEERYKGYRGIEDIRGNTPSQPLNLSTSQLKNLVT